MIPRELFEFCGTFGIAPSFWSPIYSLLQMIPQLAILLFCMVTALFKIRNWRLLFIKLRATPFMLLLPAGIIAGIWFGFGAYDEFKRRSFIHNETLTDSWPTSRYDENRSGCKDPQDSFGEEPIPLELLWTYSPGLYPMPLASSPAIAGNLIVFGSDNHDLICLDKYTGRQLWKTELRHEVYCSPAIWKGRVYVGEGVHIHDDCRLNCVDLATGEILWSFQTTSHTESPPTIADGKVYFGAGDDGIYCADALTGKMIWNHRKQDDRVYHMDASPLVVKGKVYIGSGYGDYCMVCLDAEKGDEIWCTQCPTAAWGSPLLINNFIIFGYGTIFPSPGDLGGGGIMALDSETGGIVWRFASGSPVMGPVAHRDGLLYFCCANMCLYCVDLNCQMRWNYFAGAPLRAGPVIAGDHLYFGSGNGQVNLPGAGNIFCLKSVTNKQYGELTGPPFQTQKTKGAESLPQGFLGSPICDEKRLYFTSLNGTIYCLGKDDGIDRYVGYFASINRMGDLWGDKIQNHPLAYVFLCSGVISLLLTLMFKFLTNQKKMLEYKEGMKFISAQMFENRKDVEKVMDLQKQSWGILKKQLLQMALPVLLGTLLIFFFCEIQNVAYRNIPSMTMILFSWKPEMSWIWWFFASSIPFTVVFRFLFKVE